MKGLQNKHDKDEKWIFERNPDTGVIKKRKSGDYGNEEVIDYESAALNLSGHEWINFISLLSEEQKIQLSKCWD